LSDEHGFNPAALPGGNAMFPSTGDAEQDARIAESIRRHAANETEGLCPNGCGPITIDSPSKKHCERCGFVGVTSTLKAW
jgi:hypothetical protein